MCDAGMCGRPHLCGVLTWASANFMRCFLRGFFMSLRLRGGRGQEDEDQAARTTQAAGPPGDAQHWGIPYPTVLEENLRDLALRQYESIHGPCPSPHLVPEHLQFPHMPSTPVRRQPSVPLDLCCDSAGTQRSLVWQRRVQRRGAGELALPGPLALRSRRLQVGVRQSVGGQRGHRGRRVYQLENLMRT